MVIEKLQYPAEYCNLYGIKYVPIYNQYCSFSDVTKSYNIFHDIVTILKEYIFEKLQYGNIGQLTKGFLSNALNHESIHYRMRYK